MKNRNLIQIIIKETQLYNNNPKIAITTLEMSFFKFTKFNIIYHDCSVYKKIQ